MRRSSPQMLHIYILLYSIAGCCSYRWLQYDDRFDCVVGITVDGRLVSTGVWIYYNYFTYYPYEGYSMAYFYENNYFGVILTSKNPLGELDIWQREQAQRIRVYTIDGEFDKQRSYTGECINTITNADYRVTVAHGLDGHHSPLHDLVTIHVYMQRTNETWMQRDRVPRRTAFLAPIGNGTMLIHSKYWSFAGFGYIDEVHVKGNDELEMEHYEHPVLVDCDEWLPREWGRFICVSNVDEYAGVAAGSPLFHKGLLFGIGSFALTKGNESILVFTDVRPYLRNGNQFGACYFSRDWWRIGDRMSVFRNIYTKPILPFL